MDNPLPLPQMELLLFLLSMRGGGQSARLNLDFPTPMPQCQGSSPPHTVLSLEPAPLRAHIGQLALQLLHLGLGLVQLVLIGAAQLLGVGLHTPSKARVRPSCASGLLCLAREGSATVSPWDLTALLG